MIVYRDSHHLTATFATSLVPALEAALPDLEPPPSAPASPAPDLGSGASDVPMAVDPRNAALWAKTL